MCAAQITGLASTFNSTSLKATIFLPKNEAFTSLLGGLGLSLDQVLNSTSSFTPYLGQVILPQLALFLLFPPQCYLHSFVACTPKPWQEHKAICSSDASASTVANAIFLQPTCTGKWTSYTCLGAIRHMFPLAGMLHVKICVQQGTMACSADILDTYASLCANALHRLSVYIQILEYHVVPNQVIYAANFTQGEVLTTVINDTLTVRPPLLQSKAPCAGVVSPTQFLSYSARCHFSLPTWTSSSCSLQCSGVLSLAVYRLFLK